MLDPNNPRFVTSLKIAAKVPDEKIKGMQKKLLSNFDESGMSEFFSIKDLMDSFTKVGYVPIDKIVIKEIGKGNYVVIEGNRRISALKTLRTQHDNGKVTLDEELLSDMDRLPAMELQTEGLEESEISHRISVLLGIRHHGSLLEWSALPKAFNIFKTYSSVIPQQEVFKEEGPRINQVAAILSIKKGEVKEGLISYVTFKQLQKELEGVKDRHFSLIKAVVTNPKLTRNGFITLVGKKTYELDEDSVQNIEAVCQFEIRDDLDQGQKVLNDPKDAIILGKLVEKSKIAEHEDTRALAQKGLEEAMTGELNPETEMLMHTLREALDCVIDRETRTKWLQQLKLLLETQNELKIEDFRHEGNDLMQLHQLKESGLVQVKRILGIN